MAGTFCTHMYSLKRVKDGSFHVLSNTQNKVTCLGSPMELCSGAAPRMSTCEHSGTKLPSLKTCSTSIDDQTTIPSRQNQAK